MAPQRTSCTDHSKKSALAHAQDPVTAWDLLKGVLGDLTVDTHATPLHKAPRLAARLRDPCCDETAEVIGLRSELHLGQVIRQSVFVV